MICRLYLRSKVSSHGIRPIAFSNLAIASSKCCIRSLSRWASGFASNSDNSDCNSINWRRFPEAKAIRRILAERSERTILIRPGWPSLAIPARTVLNSSNPDSCRLIRLGNSKPSNIKSRNSSCERVNEKSSIPSPESLALPPLPCPLPPSGRAILSPSEKCLLPGRTRVFWPP